MKHLKHPGPGTYNPKYIDDEKIRVKSAKGSMGRAMSDKNLTLMKQYRNTIYEKDLRTSMDIPGPGHYDPVENHMTSFTSKNKKVPTLITRKLEASKSSRNIKEQNALARS